MNRAPKLLVGLAAATLVASLASPALAAPDVDGPPRSDARIAALTVASDGPVSAASQPSAGCPATISTAEFDDVPVTSTHARAVDCLAWWGVSVGDGKYRYGPSQPVTRGQNASFLTRTLSMTARPLQPSDQLPLPTGVGLGDVLAGAAHADAIRQVVAAGVMRARSGGSFEPGTGLRRDEMATAIVAAYDLAAGTAPEDTAVVGRFADLAGHPDAAVIERAAELGFTSGATATAFDPSGTVNRAQMASFLTRLLDRLTVEALAVAPTQPSWGTTPPGRRPAATPGEGTAYSFMDKRADGTPVRWDPCTALPVYADFANAPANAEPALRHAVGRLADAMGVDVRFAGTTTVGRPLASSVPFVEGRLTVVWESAGTPYLIGHGGPRWSGWNGDYWITGGGVTMNSDWSAPTEELALGIMHELAHAVGLDHVDDAREVMNPVQTRGGPTDWGPGDLAGLALLGDGSPCRA